MYKGFLFDLDGTLVDSLSAVEEAWQLWGSRHQIPGQEILDFIHGKQAITSIRHFLTGQPESVIQQEFTWLEQYESQALDGIKPLPGAVELLTQLNDQQIPWAIVTSGSYPVASNRFKTLGFPEPAVFITAEKVEKGKPYPDPYLLGAQSLGLEPKDCVVVEDAEAGVQAGLSAGCAVVAVSAPRHTPNLAKVLFDLRGVDQLSINPEGNGQFSLSTK